MLVLVLYRGHVCMYVRVLEYVCMDVTYVLTSGGGRGWRGFFLEYDIFVYGTVPVLW